MEAPTDPKYFIVRVLMYGYLSAARNYGNCYPLHVGKIYEAIHVGRQHLEVTHPAKPGQVLYVPMATKWYWDRIAFAPEVPRDLLALT